MDDARWMVLHRCGLDPEGQWQEVNDPASPNPPDGMDADEALALIRADYEEAGVFDAVERGAFGGSVAVVIVDRWNSQTFSMSAAELRA